jgi:hypothetical protein
MMTIPLPLRFVMHVVSGLVNRQQQEVVEPAPERRKRIPWKTFLQELREVIAVADFFTVEVLTMHGVVRYFVFFVIELWRRKVEIGPDPVFLTSEGCGSKGMVWGRIRATHADMPRMPSVGDPAGLRGQASGPPRSIEGRSSLESIFQQADRTHLALTAPAWPGAGAEPGTASRPFGTTPTMPAAASPDRSSCNALLTVTTDTPSPRSGRTCPGFRVSFAGPGCGKSR